MIAYRALLYWLTGNDLPSRNQPSSLLAYNAYAIASIDSSALTYKQWIHTDPWGKGFAQKDYTSSAIKADGGTYEQWLETVPDVTAAEAVRTVDPEPLDIVSLVIEALQTLLGRQHRGHTGEPAVSP